MPINQPGTQIKLTNVSVVRLKKGGKRFEIACYKNKVLEWRSGVEKDLDEVLQINQVFNNVSKGQLANADEVNKAFGKTELEKIVLEILKKGELQVGEKERAFELDSTRREIASLVSTMCVDPTTGRPHTVGMIEKGMTEIGYSVKTNKNPKSMALDLIKQLQNGSSLKISRMQMRIRITMIAKEGKKVKDKVMELVEKVENEEWEEEWELIALISPGSLKAINDLLEIETKGRGKVETLASSVTVGNEDGGTDDMNGNMNGGGGTSSLMEGARRME